MSTWSAHKRFFLLIALLLISTAFCVGQPSLPANLQPMVVELDKAATEYAKAPNVAGVTLGIVTRDGLVWTKSYGLADIEKHTPATADTVYRIGSITKQFTALMLLQLIHAGKVHLTDSVEKYFPEINLVQGRDPAWPPITLGQLATHTAGLDREPGDVATYTTGPVSDWEKTLIAALPHTKYVATPGTKWSYSNIGYAILGAALGRAAHQPYTAYVRQHILMPLGMTHSDFEATPAIRKALAAGYESDEKGNLDGMLPAKEHNTGRGYKVPNGALYTTVGDMAQFEKLELLNGPEKVLPRKELEENFKHSVPADPALHAQRGIGFLLMPPAATDSATTFIGHSGAVAGYGAFAFFEPKTNVGIVILHNALDGEAQKLVNVFVHSEMFR
jgi:CubicO group peptidase (beta-lactamase class C family)